MVFKGGIGVLSMANLRNNQRVGLVRPQTHQTHTRQRSCLAKAQVESAANGGGSKALIAGASPSYFSISTSTLCDAGP